MLTVLIPHQRPNIIHALYGLMHQTYKDFTVVIRDAGEPSPLDATNQLLIDALVSQGTEVTVIRAMENTGVFRARAELFSRVVDDDHIVWLDSDMVVHPECLSVIDENTYSGKVHVGAKLEVYASRVYQDEIHPLGSQYRVGNAKAIRSMLTFPCFFCDMALCYQPGELLRGLDWDKLASFNQPNLAGEDVILSGMIRDLLHREGKDTSFVAHPSIYGFHMASPVFRWRWEPATDRMVRVTLESWGVDAQIIDELLPHLKREA